MSRRRTARLLSRCRAHHLSFSRESRRALLPREGFLRSVYERRTAGWRKTRLPSSLSCTWVTWRRIGRRFIARSCTTCTTTTAAVHPTGCEIRSLTIDESRTNVTSSLDTLSLVIIDVRSTRNIDFFFINSHNTHTIHTYYRSKPYLLFVWFIMWIFDIYWFFCHHENVYFFCESYYWRKEKYSELSKRRSKNKSCQMGDRKLKMLTFSKIESRKGEARRARPIFGMVAK